ncbi:MAG: ThiF family adenylyltransferase [Lentisphaerae bacterium]|nr:ThiF family adenylyltransferase [Lentisphaerota bacterium]
MKKLSFKITEESYNLIFPYLNGKERNFALALCGQKVGITSRIILFHKLIAVHEIDKIAEKFDAIVNSANEKTHVILLIHSLKETNSINSLAFKLSSSCTCATLFLEDDKLKGYVYSKNIASPFSKFSLIGDDIRFELEAEALSAEASSFTNRHAQCLGEGTALLLRKLSVGIVGVSGTGSFVTELLARLGVARMVLVDPDRVEECNLNRIINSRRSDVGKFKTEVAAEAIRNMNLGVEVKPIFLNLASIGAVNEISECDVVFGCMDSSEGRHILNRIATFYRVYIILNLAVAAC